MIRYEPLVLEVVPLVVPRMKMLAPGKGNFVALSVTLPLSELVCEKVVLTRKKKCDESKGNRSKSVLKGVLHSASPVVSLIGKVFR